MSNKKDSIMININIELFRRTAPSKKRELLESLTDEEVMKVNENTILKIVREVGEKEAYKKRSMYKQLYLEGNMACNNWNSTINKVYIGKDRELWLDVYLQGLDNDANVPVHFKRFLMTPPYRDFVAGEFIERYSNSRESKIIAKYSYKDRVAVVKNILSLYLDLKYKKE